MTTPREDFSVRVGRLIFDYFNDDEPRPLLHGRILEFAAAWVREEVKKAKLAVLEESRELIERAIGCIEQGQYIRNGQADNALQYLYRVRAAIEKGE
jgi:hypothetical protein